MIRSLWGGWKENMEKKFIARAVGLIVGVREYPHRHVFEQLQGTG